MDNMLGSLLLLALLILPSALPQQTKTVDQKLAELGRYVQDWKAVSPTLAHQEEQGETLEEVVAAAVGVRAQLEKLLVDFAELVKIAQVTQNATSQLLTDLQTLRGRQAASGAVQVSQVLMFLGYLLTILIVYMVKRCQKESERRQNQEFELIEQKLQASKAKRRAAAASARAQPEITSIPGPSRK